MAIELHLSANLRSSGDDEPVHRAAASAKGSAPTSVHTLRRRAQDHGRGRDPSASTATAALSLCPTRALKIVKTDHTCLARKRQLDRQRHRSARSTRQAEPRAACCSPPWAIPTPLPVLLGPASASTPRRSRTLRSTRCASRWRRAFSSAESRTRSSATRRTALLDTTLPPQLELSRADPLFRDELRLDQL